MGKQLAWLCEISNESPPETAFGVSNVCILPSFWYQQDIQAGKNIDRKLIGQLKDRTYHN